MCKNVSATLFSEGAKVSPGQSYIPGSSDGEASQPADHGDWTCRNKNQIAVHTLLQFWEIKRMICKLYQKEKKKGQNLNKITGRQKSEN